MISILQSPYHRNIPLEDRWTESGRIFERINWLWAVVSLKFARNGKVNRAADHDLGLALDALPFEVTYRGLVVHQMIGILPERARPCAEAA